MRIIMLTDDIEIDRRILLEAETLIKNGNEVILLAGWEEGKCLYEQIGEIKVERQHTPQFGKGDLIIIRLQNKSIKYLNKVSNKTQTIFTDLILSVQCIANKLKRWLPADKFYPLFQKIMQLFLFGILKGITFSAIFLNKVAYFSMLILRKTRRLSLRESALLDRIIYFNPDVIHAHDLPQLRVSAWGKKKLKVPLIYDAHELYPEIATLTASQKNQLGRIEERYSPQCDKVITVNHFIAEEMSRRYSIPMPLVILNATKARNGFEIGMKFDRFREVLPIPQDHQILLYQGWMSFTRGLQNLVNAMPLVSRRVHLVFMGYGEARQELEEIARNAEVTDRVHFIEAVSQEDLLFWTASADAGIIPYQPVDLNNYYCSPNKLFEFISAGLPIIANNLPFLRSIVEKEGFGVVMQLSDPSSYSDAITTMFSHDLGGSQRFKKKLLKNAKKYGWETQEALLLNIYNEISL